MIGYLVDDDHFGEGILDRHGPAVPDHAAQLHHGLHPCHRPLDVCVDQLRLGLGVVS